MHLPGIACCVLAAIAPLLWLPRLPALSTLVVIIVAGCAAGRCRDRRLRYFALWLLLLAWGILAAYEAIWPTQHLPGRVLLAQVRLTGSDNITTHRGVIERLNGKPLWPGAGITLYGEYLPQRACAGQLWEITLKVRPVHGQLNEGGFDTQRYAFATHQPVTGRFTRANVLDSRCSLRAEYLASLEATLETTRWRSVLLALGMGERRVLDAQIKAVMRETGTAHLMAISGLHIALAATLGWLLARGIQFWLPARWINWRAPLLVGLFCATGYAWLTGLQPPALRTVVSLAVLAALRLSGRQWSAWQVWLCCIAAILFIDPLAVLSESLWLSAFAVAALIFWYQWLPLPECRGGRLLRGVISLIYLQTGMMVLLLPLQVLLFHGISLTSMIANLVAVPLITFVSVPLILAGMMLHLTAFNALEGWIWARADDTLELLFRFLNALPEGWYNIDWRWQWLACMPWLLIIIWRLRLWKTVPFLCTACGVLLAQPLCKSTPQENWSVDMLDVGQGLAMVIARNGKAILYDTGLAWPGGDSGGQLIVPWLRWHNLKPEGIILSHDHLDHRGGLETLHKAWPAAWIRSPLAEAGHLPCFRGERWQWQGLTFSVHWPLPGTTSHGNNRSCVVKVDDGKNSILLTGDIEASAEQSMLSHYWQHLRATMIQVPHHGSNTSSSLPLLQRAEGHAALASASRFNAWRLPSEKVIGRYRHQGYEWFDTPHQGQISIHFSAEGWEILGLRDQLFPRWYHQWFGVPGYNR